MGAMRFRKVAGKLVGGATKLTAKAVTRTAGLVYQGAKATAKVIYDHRKKIGSAAATTVKVAAKDAPVQPQVLASHFDELNGYELLGKDGSGNSVYFDKGFNRLRMVSKYGRLVASIFNAGEGVKAASPNPYGTGFFILGTIGRTGSNPAKITVYVIGNWLPTRLWLWNI